MQSEEIIGSNDFLVFMARGFQLRNTLLTHVVLRLRIEKEYMKNTSVTL